MENATKTEYKEENVSNNNDASIVNGSEANSLHDLTSMIQDVLHQTQDRFQKMSDQIINRIDTMTKRVDDLERNITDLMTQAGMDHSEP